MVQPGQRESVGSLGRWRGTEAVDFVPALLLTLAYLAPTHEPPWVAFDAEVSTVLALTICVRRHLVPSLNTKVVVPMESIVVAAIALVPLLHFVATSVGYFGDALMATLYLGAFAVSMMVGASASFHTSGEARNVAGGVIVAAALSSAIGITQVVTPYLDLPGLLVSANQSGRALGNLAQPNLLATLLTLGALASTCGFEFKYLRRWQWLSLNLLFVVGLGATQSRTGALAFAGLIAVALALRARGASGSAIGPSRADLLILVTALSMSLSLVSWQRTDRLSIGQARSQAGVLDGATASVRLAHWTTLRRAVIASPLRGYGWNQTAVAQSLHLESSDAPHEFIEHAHNLPLDLLVWNGLLIGTMLIAGGLLLLLRACWPVVSRQGLYATAAIAVMLLHAMVEFPLSFLYFLVPFGMLVGSQLYWRSACRVAILGPAFAGVMVLCAIVGVMVAAEYRELRSYLAPARQLVMSASILNRSAYPVPEVRLLTQLQTQAELLNALFTDQPKQSWRTLEEWSLRFGQAPVLVRLAQRAREGGEFALAERLLDRMCATTPAKVCAAGRAAVR